ncbi:MAG: hypothetical protein ACXVPN_05065 [Bacteroidia bacterium]
MRSSGKYYLALLLAILITGLSSCHKKWKKPTEVSFRFQLNQNSGNGQIKFTSASLFLSKMSVSADRKQSPPHIDLQQTVNSDATFFVSSPSPAYRFDIPQGSYSALNVKYETTGNQNSAALTINGTYTDSSGTTFAVQFRLSAGDVNTITAKNPSGGNEITLVEGHSANATIYLNPNYWFAASSANMMDDADVEIVNGVPTIIIDDDENEDIYELVVLRIKDGNECVFN